MSESDPIVEEVRRVRDAHAAKFNYDPDAIFRDIKEQEKRSGRKYVSVADAKVAPNQAVLRHRQFRRRPAALRSVGELFGLVRFSVRHWGLRQSPCGRVATR